MSSLSFHYRHLLLASPSPRIAIESLTVTFGGLYAGVHYITMVLQWIVSVQRCSQVISGYEDCKEILHHVSILLHLLLIKMSALKYRTGTIY